MTSSNPVVANALAANSEPSNFSQLMAATENYKRSIAALIDSCINEIEKKKMGILKTAKMATQSKQHKLSEFYGGGKSVVRDGIPKDMERFFDAVNGIESIAGGTDYLINDMRKVRDRWSANK